MLKRRYALLLMFLLLMLQVAPLSAQDFECQQGELATTGGMIIISNETNARVIFETSFGTVTAGLMIDEGVVSQAETSAVLDEDSGELCITFPELVRISDELGANAYIGVSGNATAQELMESGGELLETMIQRFYAGTYVIPVHIPFCLEDAGCNAIFVFSPTSGDNVELLQYYNHDDGLSLDNNFNGEGVYDAAFVLVLSTNDEDGIRQVMIEVAAPE